MGLLEDIEEIVRAFSEDTGLYLQEIASLQSNGAGLSSLTCASESRLSRARWIVHE